MDLYQSYIIFLEEYLFFLQEWSKPINLVFIAIDSIITIVIINRLLKTKHASLGKNGQTNDIGCGDKRVYRDFVIFGGPAGLTFGLPYFFVYGFLPTGGIVFEIFKAYWAGFIYVQFALSIIQTAILLLYCLFGKRPDDSWRLFKSHLKGCGYISAVSPVGWIAYAIQQKLPNELTFLMWRLRDIETLLAFASNLLSGATLVICLVATMIHMRLIIPWISWIDEDHEDDEDSSQNIQK